MTETTETAENTWANHYLKSEQALYAALSAFQGEMPVIEKKKTATIPSKTGRGYQYSYADLADIMSAIAGLLGKNGLAFTCTPTIRETGMVLQAQLVHKDGAMMVGEMPITGGSPQQIGAELTYKRRYLLACLTGVVTDDDVDGSMAEGPQQAVKTPAQPVDVASPATVDAVKAAVIAAGYAPDFTARAVKYTSGNRTQNIHELTEAEARQFLAKVQEQVAATDTGEGSQ